MNNWFFDFFTFGFFEFYICWLLVNILTFYLWLWICFFFLRCSLGCFVYFFHFIKGLFYFFLFYFFYFFCSCTSFCIWLSRNWRSCCDCSWNRRVCLLLLRFKELFKFFWIFFHLTLRCINLLRSLFIFGFNTAKNFTNHF